MFSIKWLHYEQGERLYRGRDLLLHPSGKFSFVKDDGTESSMDTGIIFVMNDSGSTIAKYDLDQMNGAGHAP